MVLIPIKAFIPESCPSFIKWVVKLKVKDFWDLEKSIDYNKWYILLNVKEDKEWEWYYLQINDYHK